ncbi:hypothetical protein Pint_13506 [Pistacia integerrima]|uniref:Uncharacterized protein n=1 Tax=Pistacia integerrima TaxID=434235 RepID=A0ACC0YB59_9ROSI|nr:hypothetical protein Pint_13506 [Pistacia integerrima]
MDLGASHHVTDHPAALSNVSPYVGPQQLTVGDGVSLPITHTGTIEPTLSSPYRLSNVLVVPSIAKNLLSVSQFTKDNNCVFLFYPNYFFAISLHMGQTLLHGKFDRGLYRVSPSKLVSPSSILTASYTSPNKFNLWHHRLGHAIPKTIIRLLHSTNNFSYKDPKINCTACALSKSHRHHHPPTQSRATRPLQLVHFDIYGLSPVTSFNNYRYYVCFIDDFSQFSWFYPFTSCTQFLDIFISFHKFVENQL